MFEQFGVLALAVLAFVLADEAGGNVFIAAFVGGLAAGQIGAVAALAVAGMGFRPSTIAFMGWFGPRGLASIILALVVTEEKPELPALGTILAMTVTVLASVALHGLSAPPLVRAYAREVERLTPDAPELSDGGT